MDGWQTVGKQSKEDQLNKISQSIIVTNFSIRFFPKDIWKSCEQYGIAANVFIAKERSNACKGYAFVRFINVDNLTLIVSNRCTIWNGRLHMHANISKYLRGSKPNGVLHHARKAEVTKTQSKPTSSRFEILVKLAHDGGRGSYATVVRGVCPGGGYHSSGSKGDELHAMVLNDSCLNDTYLSLKLVGKVKEFGSLLKL